MRNFNFSPVVVAIVSLAVILMVIFSPSQVHTRRPSKAEKQLLEIREILKMGLNPNTQNAFGNTLLMVSSGWGDFNLVQQLLTLGVDVDARNKMGWTALMMSADNGHAGIVKLLLEHGANPKGECLIFGSAADLAEFSGHKGIAKVIREALIKVEAEANIEDSTEVES